MSARWSILRQQNGLGSNLNLPPGALHHPFGLDELIGDRRAWPKDRTDTAPSPYTKRRIGYIVDDD